MSSHVFHELQTGQVILLKIHEVNLGDASLILSLEGKLIRVVNQTERQFRTGQWIHLRVLQVHPPKFKIV